MTPFAVAVLGGGSAGLGAATLLRAWHPAPELLTAALSRITQPVTPAPPVDPEIPGVSRWGRQAGGWLTDRLTTARFGIAVPQRDLALLGQPVDLFGLRKLLMALFGLTLPGWITVVLLAVGVQLPLTLPAFTGLLLGLGFFFAPDLVVRGAAREAREAFTASVGAYLDLVALERAADGGAAEALERAAGVADGWVFRRIRESLERARGLSAFLCKDLTC